MRRFFRFVEIRTKITSVFPFCMTAAWLYASHRTIRFLPTAVFFVSMLSFVMAPTANNNYVDCKKSGHSLPFAPRTALVVLFSLLIISTVFGLFLVYLSDAVVLLIGMLCFACGILYSFGPLPISATPFGEALSGIFYGLFIPLLMLYINNPPGYFFTLFVDYPVFCLVANMRSAVVLLLLALIPVFTTANIMLANNACDVQRDIAVLRYTLPHYLGRRALHLYVALYVLCYVDVPIMVLMGVLSPVCLLFLLTWVIVQKNIKTFLDRQEKETTFQTAVGNYVVINGAIALLILVSRFTG